MFDQRVKIFVGFSLALLLICVLRLAQMQLLAESRVQDEIARLKDRYGQSKQLKTLRGTIFDRRGRVVATDRPRFQIYVDYRLSCYLDDRVVLAKELNARRERADPIEETKVRDQVEKNRRQIEDVIQECSRFGASREQIEDTIRARNNWLWNRRSHVAWARSDYDPKLVAEYGSRVSVPLAKALEDLRRQFSDPNDLCRVIARVNDIPELNKKLAVVELQTEDDVFAAQVEFREIADVNVLPTGHRYYPYGPVAAQTIGWVGRADPDRDNALFPNDPQASYLPDEMCGREDGVEYVCESILRGRRGELVYDIDRQLIREVETRFGQDVQLTLDIELQKQIEEYMSSAEKNPSYYDANMAAAVIDVDSGDILAMVSLPTYDLNAARYDYGKLVNDANRPLINRAINHLYPPASVVKPLILVAGLETGVITPEEPISCPSQEQPKGWPNCLIFRLSGVGHDSSWINNARNALKGSCNVYFAHLADRVESRQLQEWLFRFGYGHQIPLVCPVPPDPNTPARSLRQAAGQIASTGVPQYTDIVSLDQIPPLKAWHRRLFGIGHGDFRVTPLQVANTFATLARGGRRQMPRLFLRPPQPPVESVDLQVAPTTLAPVYAGLSAVVNEPGGSAYKPFQGSTLHARGVKVYGKTGSSEAPENAWFAGYAEDRRGSRIAIAVVIEGGQRGGSDAGPLGRAILELCVEAGYLGN
ncbi:MAG TPA: penicillin-binding transpeptidase domain-containing protein [Sedimentisphaerales bacterium]|jgi:penicillin-binding protein 2|nr:penicillin-binding transpeptidase domain-containing protein [Sedimentisphaerales bacterium]HNU30255.1 penicillin-binding transpeptidase domain-containing protein [Sedimentisphaerales bacterium]